MHTLKNFFFSKISWGVSFPFIVDSFGAFLLCLHVLYLLPLCGFFAIHSADSVNLYGDSGAPIMLPAPVCSGLTPETVVYSQPCGHGGPFFLFVCLDRKALSFVRFVKEFLSLSLFLYPSIHCDVAQECCGGLC